MTKLWLSVETEEKSSNQETFQFQANKRQKTGPKQHLTDQENGLHQRRFKLCNNNDHA